MIHDTQEERDQTIKFLKSLGLYNEYLSTQTMQIAHTIYWSIKDKKAKEAFHLPDGSVTHDSGLAAEQWAEVSFKLRDVLKEISKYADENSGFAYSYSEKIEKALDLCPERII